MSGSASVMWSLSTLQTLAMGVGNKGLTYARKGQNSPYFRKWDPPQSSRSAACGRELRLGGSASVTLMFSSRSTLPLSRKCSPNDHIASRSRRRKSEALGDDKDDEQSERYDDKDHAFALPV
jgi:hypothetical protein